MGIIAGLQPAVKRSLLIECIPDLPGLYVLPVIYLRRKKNSRETRGFSAVSLLAASYSAIG